MFVEKAGLALCFFSCRAHFWRPLHFCLRSCKVFSIGFLIAPLQHGHSSCTRGAAPKPSDLLRSAALKRVRILPSESAFLEQL